MICIQIARRNRYLRRAGRRLSITWPARLRGQSSTVALPAWHQRAPRKTVTRQVTLALPEDPPVELLYAMADVIQRGAFACLSAYDQGLICVQTAEMYNLVRAWTEKRQS